jgi:HemY protein
VLLTARALAAEEGDRDRARGYALDAVKLAPSLVPAAELAGRLLGEAGELKRAGRVLEAAWKANPHPDLADAYAHLRPGDSARERLARIESLAQRAPGHVESALAVARAALDAQEFTVARSALRPLTKEPTQRVAELMAELEERESGDEGRAREWMARAVHAARDPAWTADGIVSDRWLPVSPVSGRLDAFQWKVPLEELGDEREVIEAGKPAPAREAPAIVQRPPAPAAGKAAEAKPAAATAPTARRRAAPPAEEVVPIVHVPDDPGPDGAPEPDPEPAATGRIRLFK